MQPETGYKLCKFYENCGRGTPLRGVYIPHFDKISVKISVLGVLYSNRCTNGAKFGTPPCQISPRSVHRCGAKNLKIGLSKLNTGVLHFAQCCQ